MIYNLKVCQCQCHYPETELLLTGFDRSNFSLGRLAVRCFACCILAASGMFAGSSSRMRFSSTIRLLSELNSE